MLQEFAVTPNLGTQRALILKVYDDEARLLVRLASDPDEPVFAALAVAWSDDIRPGATVLATADADGQWYAVGLLASPRPAAQQLRMPCGVRAVAEYDDEPAGSMRVYSATGDLMFEYRAGDGGDRQTRIHLPRGDVQFVARDGRLEFLADQGIRLQSEADVQIRGQAGVGLAASAPGSAGPSLSLGHHQASMSARRVGVVSEQLDVDALETQMIGRTFVGRFLRTRIVAETLETLGGSLVQKVKNLFQTVQGIHRQRSGSIHTTADESLHMKAGDVIVKSDRDVKIKGEQIHLA